MAIVTPSDDILVVGQNLYSFKASSAISGAAFVKPAGPMQVVHASANSCNTIGVALYETAAGKMITIAGPYCIVRCCVSSAVTAGDDLYAAATGKVHAGGFYGTYASVGIALEGIASSGAVRVLLR